MRIEKDVNDRQNNFLLLTVNVLLFVILLVLNYLTYQT